MDQWRRARVLWSAWAVLSGSALLVGLLQPPWQKMGMLVLGLVGLGILGVPRQPNRVTREHWEALWRQHPDHPFRAMARRVAGVAVMFAGYGTMLWPLRHHPRLQPIAFAVGTAGLVDSTLLFHRTRAWLTEQERIRLAPVVRQPEPGWPHTYAELWTDEPELPASEADQWEAFVERAADASHDAHDDLTQIDTWYETPPEPR